MTLSFTPRIVKNFIFHLGRDRPPQHHSSRKPSIFDTIPAMLLVSFGIHLP